MTVRLLLPIALLSFLALGFVAKLNAASVMWYEDFESGTLTSTSSNAGLNYSIITDPFGGTSKVLKIDDISTTSEWTEMRSTMATGGNFFIGSYPELVPGAVVTFKFDIYFPSGGSAEGLAAVLRLRTNSSGTPYKDASLSPGINPANVTQQNVWLRDQTITLTIPETFLHGDPSTAYSADYLSPIISFRDTTPQGSGSGAGGSTGVFAYLDNLSVVITPEPSKALLMYIAFMGVILRRGRHS